MMEPKTKKVLVFIAISVLIGVFFAIIQGFGYFSKFDALLYGFDSIARGHEGFDPVSTILVIVFALIPGISIVLWGNEKGLLMSVGVLIAYYGFAWGYWKTVSETLPLIATALAAGASVIRAFGWKPAFDMATQTGDAKRASSLNGKMGYDVFISYRREGGAETARLIRSELQKRGIDAFLDVDDLGASHFDERLLGEIERASSFVLILSPGSLRRCREEGDWLRREIAHAIEKKKNIVPVLKDGFDFPPVDSLPSQIADLPRYNCVVYSHAYFGATIDKLISFL
jgi:hypothetical protein